MAKNIVLLSDGTGNSSTKIFKTNVWRLFQALDLTDPTQQLAYYDDGVGTDSNKYIAAITGVLGYGLKRNVLDIYCFLCRNYKAGDRIYGFGFSRGSFTMRVVAGFVARIGLVKYTGNETDLASNAEIAYREYRKRGTSKTIAAKTHLWIIRGIRDWFSRRVGKPSFKQIKIEPVEKIHFLGLWDTVDAYGGPIDEIVRAIDYWYWPLSMPDRFMNWKIQRACHALSLEDARDAFKPVLWDERYVSGADHRLHSMSTFPGPDGWAPPKPSGKPVPAIDQERISQVWFVGMHSDVGGGYPQDGLGYFTLDWMIDRARAYDLRLLDVQTAWLKSLVDPFDKLNDSRSGAGGYYRYKPRKLEDIYKLPPYRLSVSEDRRNIKRIWRGLEDPELEVQHQLVNVPLLPRPTPKIHEGVFKRIDARVDGYIPIVLPEVYRVTDKDGAIFDNPDEPSKQATARAQRQEKVWDLVWKRRVIYFVTMFVLFLIVLMPVFQHLCPGLGVGSPFAFIVPPIDGVASVLPDFLKPWFDAFRNGPERLVAGIALVTFLTWRASTVQERMRDLMRAIWREPKTEVAAPTGRIYDMRTSGKYRASFYVLNHWILPSIFAVLIGLMLLYCGFIVVSFVNRIMFGFAEATGQVCVSSAATSAVSGKQDDPKIFETSERCHATGMVVAAGETYRLTLTIPQKAGSAQTSDKLGPWFDSTIPTSPKGFGAKKPESSSLLPFMIPFRRLIWSNWFATVVRVGSLGFEEHVLDMKPDNDPCNCTEPSTGSYSGTFKAGKNGEVFVFVNDAVMVRSEKYYHNNHGTASVTIELVRPDKPPSTRGANR